MSDDDTVSIFSYLESTYSWFEESFIILFTNADKFLLDVLNSMIPFVKVAANKLDEPAVHKSHSANFEIEKFEGGQTIKDFREKIEPYRRSKTQDIHEFENKVDISEDFDLDFLKEDYDDIEDDTDFHILWSYYHDTKNIFKDTCDDIPYDLRVDEQGFLIFTKKNVTNIDMIYSNPDNIPEVVVKYNIKYLLETTPAIISGLDNIIFTISVNNDIIALDPSGKMQNTSLKDTKEIPERFKTNAIFLHK
jgi:hypothetical protein